MSRLREMKVTNGVQCPVPTNSDSVYSDDIDITRSDSTGWVGDLLDLFGSLVVGISYSGATNPKAYTVYFNRTVITNAMGLGTETGNFSNVKIIGLFSGGPELVLYDGSADSVVRTTQSVQFTPIGVAGFRVEFHTANSVEINNMVILKTTPVVARLEAQKDDGIVAPIKATNLGNLHVSVQEYGDTPAIDAFARLRVSQNFTVFDSKQLHDKQPLFWDEELGGSATSTHVSVDAATKLAVTASASDYVIRQTKQRFNYQPGKSQLIFMTFYSPQNVGVTNRIGSFDGTGTNNLTPNNGVFLEVDGVVSWNICKNGVIEETATQDNWNVDKLDGTGSSGIELNCEATQIMVLDYEWLGVGRVRVGFVIDGIIHYCHYFNHANDPAFTAVYMSSPNLPLRYSIESDGTSSGNLDHICSTVISEGGIEKTGVLRAVDMGGTTTGNLSAATDYAIIGIRLKTAYNDVTVIPEGVSVVGGTNNDAFRWSIQLNPTINGTFTYTDLASSGVQSALGGNTNDLSAEGLVLSSGYASRSAQQVEAALNTALRIGTTIAGVADELVLVITPMVSNTQVSASLNFRELL
jgi:hypothetical protein